MNIPTTQNNMSKEIEGAPAPKSEAEQAIAELEKEGHSIEGKETTTPPVDEKPKDEKPKDVPAEKKGESSKKDDIPPRTPTMVEAWKLKVATEQNEKNQKLVEELSAKLDEVSKQKEPVTKVQEKEIFDDIKTLAEKKGVDPEFLTEFAESILKKAEQKYRTSDEITKTVQKLAETAELSQQEGFYTQEFEKDIVPIVKEKYQLSDQALSQLKNDLKDLAFSETYAKVPLIEIFKAKEDGFELKAPKRSSEGTGIKVRGTDIVDLDNISEEEFRKLPPEAVEKIMSRNSSSSGWRKPGQS